VALVATAASAAGSGTGACPALRASSAERLMMFGSAAILSRMLLVVSRSCSGLNDAAFFVLGWLDYHWLGCDLRHGCWRRRRCWRHHFFGDATAHSIKVLKRYL